MQVKAPAKVNLSLHVVGKRPDGYHLLHTLMVHTDICDLLTIEPSDRFCLNVKGERITTLAQEDIENNSVTKAVRAVAAEAKCKPNVTITLEKHIPIGAGLGGGSADAAATLNALKHYWKPAISDEKWYEIALSLGADVPFCFHGKAALIEGIGEKYSDVPPLPELWGVLVNPNEALSTKQVFEAGIEPFSDVSHLPKANWSDMATFKDYLAVCSNDLEAAAIRLKPVILDILDVLNQQDGAYLSRMSGSGATCYALFESRESALNAEQRLQKHYPHWWVRATHMY